MKTVIVTAIGSFSAAAVIKSLKEAGYRVLGTDINLPEVLSESVSVDRFYRVPRYDAGAAYVDALGEIIRGEQADAVLPLTDAELDILSEARQKLLPAALWTFDAENVRRARDKRRTAEAMERVMNRLGAACPVRTIPSEPLAEKTASDLLRQLPLVLKPVNGRSSEGLYRVKDDAALSDALKEIRKNGAEKRYLVQPLFEGHVICADTVRDRFGNTVCVPREELKRTANGAGLSVRIIREPALEQACEALSAELGILGAVNYEFIRADDGTFRFLECNPRFSGGVGFSTAAGCDIVKAAAAVFEGARIPADLSFRPCSVVKKYIEVITDPC